MKSNKIFGILLLLIYVCVTTAMLNDNFIKPFNLQNLLRSSSMFAIIGIGAVFVIVTGGIDLSIGSLIGLVGCTMTLTMKSWMDYPPAENGSYLFRMIGVEMFVIAIALCCWNHFKHGDPLKHRKTTIVLFAAGSVLFATSFLLKQLDVGPWLTVAVAVALALLLSLHIGWLHGILITKLRLQPFIVTLAGLMCYRGLTRFFANDKTQGLGTEYNDSLRLMATGRPCTFTFVMLVSSIALIAAGIWTLGVGLRGDRERSKLVVGVTALIFGIVLCVVSSSRYWDGWETKYGKTICSIGATEFKFFELEIAENAVHRPAELMGYAWVPLTLCVLALLSLNFQTQIGDRGAKNDEMDWMRWFSLFWPLAVALAAGAGLFISKRWIGDESISVPKILPWQSGSDLMTWAKIGAVFSLMAILIFGVIRLGKSWTAKTGIEGRACWYGVGFFAVLWLLSKTAINETIVQTPFFFLVVVGIAAAIFLNKTVQGRYLQALGNNEDAAKYSGVNIDNMKIIAYMICSGCAGLGGILFTLDSNNVEPSSHGSFYELYAIAAAVLGGCSLRGGEGSILGVIIGATIMRVLQNAPNMIGIPQQLELFTMGTVILIGVIADETARRLANRRDQKSRR